MKKDVFESIILDMGCTEKVMPNQNDVISDQEIISKIEKIADLEKKDRDGRTLLMNAACYARIEVIKYLLNRGADIYAKDNADFTALHAGVMSKDVGTIKLLLKAGADINAKNKFGNNPIMLGDYTTDLEVYKILIANGADPEQKNNYGVSAMDIFACSSDIIGVLSQR